MWERFWNKQSDLDWTWGPLLRLRPPRTEPIHPWLWVRLFLAMTLLGSLGLVLLVAADIYGFRWAAARHVPLPPPVAEAQSTLAAMTSDRGTQVLLLTLFLCLPPLFFAFCLPYHWAWNRRAARLRKQPLLTETKAAREAVWPPAPRASS